MSAAKHTPGPWEFVLAGSGNHPTWNVRLGNRGFIRLPATTDMDTMDADARLIAAAPDLLEALRTIVVNASSVQMDPQWAVQVARAAIAKAEGA